MDIHFHISPVHNNESAKLVDLILPIQQIEFNVPVTLNDQPDLLDVDRFYHGSGGGFWAARHGEEIIGSIALINTGHNSGAIRKMFVKKEFRGKQYGIAQQLLDELTAFCAGHVINHLYLGTVGVLQAAQRFYEKNGFTRIEMTNLPPWFPRMAADHIFYEKLLSTQKT